MANRGKQDKQENNQGTRIKFSDKLAKILATLEDNNSYIAFELTYLEDPKSKYHNGLNISDVDVSTDYNFLVTVNGKKHPMKIGKFIRYYFPGLFNDWEITTFANAYNKVKGGGSVVGSGKRISVERFKYNPKDPRSTFLSMVTKTYPHGHEDEVLDFLPPLDSDGFGNYFKVIGKPNPESMFTSHLDTADRQQTPVSLYTRQEDGDEIIYTDGTTILGADDKSGVTVMLYMMAHKVPGIYYFFIGEERGGIGSHRVANEFSSIEVLKNVKRCVSFDRRRTISVITHQMGRQCCSDAFGNALANEYNKSGLNLSLDPGGVYTDSASFIDDIPECTNISVGYENEHTGRELQNMTYLDKLCKASINVNWDSLPVARRVGLNQEIIEKHKTLIAEIKKTPFSLDVKMIGFQDSIFIRVDLEEGNMTTIHNDLIWIQSILNKHKVPGDVLLYDGYLKIELK
jgi:hypothetical protein